MEHAQGAVPLLLSTASPHFPALGEALVTLELCAGSAMLSAILKRDGFNSIAVDFTGNRHKPHVHAQSLDLRLDSTWRFLEHLVFTQVLFHCHAGPPCGTCQGQVALNFRMGHLDRAFLRDEAHPLEYPWLSGEELKRVQSANAVYLKLGAFVRWLYTLGIGFSVENPRNSLLWWIPEYVNLQDIVTSSTLIHVCLDLNA